MKKLLVLFLALPAIAYGSATLNLNVAGVDNVTVNPGDTFDLQMFIQTSPASQLVAGVGAQLNASANGVFSVAADSWTWATSIDSISTKIFFNIGDFADPIALGTQEFYDGNVSYPNIGFYKTSTTAPNYATTIFSNGLIALTLPVTVAADAKGGAYTLSIPSRDIGYISGTDSIVVATSGHDLTVNVTPEPTTMLLLALALPFLRRRSA